MERLGWDHHRLYWPQGNQCLLVSNLCHHTFPAGVMGLGLTMPAKECQDHPGKGRYHTLHSNSHIREGHPLLFSLKIVCRLNQLICLQVGGTSAGVHRLAGCGVACELHLHLAPQACQTLPQRKSSAGESMHRTMS